MWKCPRCETMNEGAQCVLCGYGQKEFEQDYQNQDAASNMNAQFKNAGIKSTLGSVPEDGDRTRTDDSPETVAVAQSIPLEKLKKEKCRMSIAIAAATVLMAFLMLISCWVVHDMRVFLWQIFISPSWCTYAGLYVLSFEKIGIILMVVMCFMPCITSFEKISSRHKTLPVVISVITFLMAVIFCGYIHARAAGSYIETVGVFPKMVPLITLVLIFLVRAKINAIKKIEKMSYT